MALDTSYTSFGTSVASWLLDDNAATVTSVGVSMMADLITVGEKRIFRELRVREMETALSASISAGLLALPSSYLALKSAYVDTAPNQSLERRDSGWIRENYPQDTTSGVPVYIARYGGNFIFGPYPDSGYTVKGIYYKQLTAISGAGLNEVFSTYPDLYLFGVLSQGMLVIGQDDPRLQLWEQMYQRTLADANGMDKAEQASGSTLQMRPIGANRVAMR